MVAASAQDRYRSSLGAHPCSLWSGTLHVLLVGVSKPSLTQLPFQISLAESLPRNIVGGDGRARARACLLRHIAPTGPEGDRGLRGFA